MEKMYLKCLSVLLLFLISAVAYAQKTVSETEKYASGEPLPVVSIRIKRSQNATNTSYPINEKKMRKSFGSGPNNKFSAFNYFIAYDEVYFPYLIIAKSDDHLLKAEIYQRGMGVAKNAALAKTEYEAGITFSINFWYSYTQNSPRWLTKSTVPSAAQIAKMPNNLAILYNGANHTDVPRKTTTHAWLSKMFERAEACTIVRRICLTPKDVIEDSQVVNKLPYPDDESIIITTIGKRPVEVQLQLLKC